MLIIIIHFYFVDFMRTQKSMGKFCPCSLPPHNACPPDTLITCPVSILACSLERNNIVSAMSSGCINLPIGIKGMTAFSRSASIHPVCVWRHAIHCDAVLCHFNGDATSECLHRRLVSRGKVFS